NEPLPRGPGAAPGLRGALRRRPRGEPPAPERGAAEPRGRARGPGGAGGASRGGRRRRCRDPGWRPALPVRGGPSPSGAGARPRAGRVCRVNGRGAGGLPAPPPERRDVTQGLATTPLPRALASVLLPRMVVGWKVSATLASVLLRAIAPH